MGWPISSTCRSAGRVGIPAEGGLASSVAKAGLRVSSQAVGEQQETSAWANYFLMSSGPNRVRIKQASPPPNDSVLHVFSGVTAPRKHSAIFCCPRCREGFQLCATPREVYSEGEGPAGQMGPQASVSCWSRPTAARRHPGFQMWGVAMFVFLVIELLMPHLSTSPKQSFLDAFRNPSLCGLSGLVSICGEADFSCRELSKPSRAEVTKSLVSCRRDSGRSLQESGFLMKYLCSL